MLAFFLGAEMPDGGIAFANIAGPKAVVAGRFPFVTFFLPSLARETACSITGILCSRPRI